MNRSISNRVTDEPILGPRRAVRPSVIFLSALAAPGPPHCYGHARRSLGEGGHPRSLRLDSLRSLAAAAGAADRTLGHTQGLPSTAARAPSARLCLLPSAFYLPPASRIWRLFTARS